MRRVLLFFLIQLCPLACYSHGVRDDALLEIHYINVGQGGSTLILGPNGTSIIYDFGNYSGLTHILPYLKRSPSFSKDRGFDYAFLSHNHRDHFMGYKEFVENGWQINVANYDNGADKSEEGLLKSHWLDPAKSTNAGPVRPVPIGLSISLGNSAELIVVGARGKILGRDEDVRITNENDNSIALLIRYGNFHFILDGDLGGGPDSCTQHVTKQKNIQSLVAKTLIDLALIPKEFGVDVMHIAHHGSESSTTHDYYNQMKPEVGLMSIGLKNRRYQHPKKSVVETVLLRPIHGGCVKALPLSLLLQTEDGEIKSAEDAKVVSNAGLSVGDILLKTNGLRDYTIEVSGRVSEGSEVETPTGYWLCALDEVVTDNSAVCQIQSADVN